jgi:cobalt-zinc-cadmium efflux system outer membrane protein
MPLLWIKHASWRRLIVFTGIALLGSVSLAAYAAGLTLEEVVGVAIHDNKDLQAARYAVEAARARLLQAGLLPNPRLDLSGKSDSIFNNEGEYTANVGFSQQFPIAGRIARQKDVAQADVALALAEINEAERKLAGDVVASFYRILALDRQIEVRDRLVGVDQQLAEVARNRFRAAEVSELDVNTSQLEMQRLTQERTLLLSQRATQLAQLNQLLGQSAAQPLALDNTLPTIEPLPSLIEAQQRALALRPDLRFALLNADRARADLALAHAQRWEDWTVGLGVEQSRLVVQGVPPQDRGRALGLTLSVPLPLLNKNQGRIAEAATAGAQAAARIEALKLNIENEVATTYAETERLRSALQQYQQNILPLGDRNVRLAQQGYNQGLVSVLEVVQAQRQQSELNISYLNTLDQYLQALMKQRLAVGDYTANVTPPDQKPPYSEPKGK